MQRCSRSVLIKCGVLNSESYCIYARNFEQHGTHESRKVNTDRSD